MLANVAMPERMAGFLEGILMAMSGDGYLQRQWVKLQLPSTATSASKEGKAQLDQDPFAYLRRQVCTLACRDQAGSRAVQ